MEGAGYQAPPHEKAPEAPAAVNVGEPSADAQYTGGERENGYGNGPQLLSTSGSLEVICGPLLNYKHMDGTNDAPVWNGSVLLVTSPGQQRPQLQLRSVGPVPQAQAIEAVTTGHTVNSEGVKLYSDPRKEFWRFSVAVPITADETRWEYSFPNFTSLSETTTRSWNFVVPSSEQSMRLMFHSCNGFSVGTDMDTWKGPSLWNDVLRTHEKRPFHVMIGGGDQIYNDGIRVNGPLKAWTAIGNPHRRREYLFDNTLRAECDEYYFDNYVTWFSTEPFATANAQIPQINIWDDHDIIDGFGSYTDHFMKCAVFRGIGGVSFKYYCLFQHHTAPPKSTFTTDAPQTMKAVNGTAGADPRQLEDTFVLEESTPEPSWIIGDKPGPYVEERSRNLYMRLGKRMAFVGIDARTERTRHQINYPETYDKIMARLDSELTAANGEITHLILLLGVPIAYPRLAWLENILTSPVIAPLRLLNKRFGVAGSFFNQFDGQVDLLDDLDDHYTARQHKRERRSLIQRFQSLAKHHSVRVTILGGDVHLAAVGRFYSHPKLNIAADHDYRYMANIVSSAITNKPPPKAVANLLARRNKIHHLDSDTDETLMDLFDMQPGGNEKSATWNKVTMPSRNYACLTEVEPRGLNGTVGENMQNAENGHTETFHPKDGHSPLHIGEANAGSKSQAADGVSSASGEPGGLDVSIRVEIDPSDTTGVTEGYGFSIPPLTVVPTSQGSRKTRHHLRPHSRRSAATSTADA